MRLINTSTLQLEEFFDADIPRYAILSHTWIKGEEVTFQEFQGRHKLIQHRSGFAKIKQTCKLALKDGFGWAWVDTCSIDKTSSSELSEAINSMFQWYQRAGVCYVYLSDVTADSEQDLPPFNNEPRAFNDEEFASSRWHTRGWTLQELLAPNDVLFYDRLWHFIGSKAELCGIISRTTSIPKDALRSRLQFPYDHYTTSDRMSWASKRETSRKEDLAYCLMGLFEIHMPLLYGEGMKAFQRLQEEIVRKSRDQTIFVWILDHDSIYSGEGTLFAPSPANFSLEEQILRLPDEAFGDTSTHSLSNRGIQFHAPVVTCEDQDFIILACRSRRNLIGPIGLAINLVANGTFVINRRIYPSVFSADTHNFLSAYQNLCVQHSQSQERTMQTLSSQCLVRYSGLIERSLIDLDLFHKRTDNRRKLDTATFDLEGQPGKGWLVIGLDGENSKTLIRVLFRSNFRDIKEFHEGALCSIQAVDDWHNKFDVSEIRDGKRRKAELKVHALEAVISVRVGLVDWLAESTWEVNIEAKAIE